MLCGNDRHPHGRSYSGDYVRCPLAGSPRSVGSSADSRWPPVAASRLPSPVDDFIERIPSTSTTCWLPTRRRRSSSVVGSSMSGVGICWSSAARISAHAFSIESQQRMLGYRSTATGSTSEDPTRAKTQLLPTMHSSGVHKFSECTNGSPEPSGGSG